MRCFSERCYAFSIKRVKSNWKGVTFDKSLLITKKVITLAETKGVTRILWNCSTFCLMVMLYEGTT